MLVAVPRRDVAVLLTIWVALRDRASVFSISIGRGYLGFRSIDYLTPLSLPVHQPASAAPGASSPGPVCFGPRSADHPLYAARWFAACWCSASAYVPCYYSNRRASYRKAVLFASCALAVRVLQDLREPPSPSTV